MHRILWLGALLGKSAFCTCHLDFNSFLTIPWEICWGDHRSKYVYTPSSAIKPTYLFFASVTYTFCLPALSVIFYCKFILCQTPSPSKPMNLLKSLLDTKGSPSPLESGRMSMNICFNLVQRCPNHLYQAILEGYTQGLLQSSHFFYFFFYLLLPSCSFIVTGGRWSTFIFR